MTVLQAGTRAINKGRFFEIIENVYIPFQFANIKGEWKKGYKKFHKKINWWELEEHLNDKVLGYSVNQEKVYIYIES